MTNIASGVDSLALEMKVIVFIKVTCQMKSVSIEVSRGKPYVF